MSCTYLSCNRKFDHLHSHFQPPKSLLLINSNLLSFRPPGVPGHAHSAVGWAMTQPPCLGSGRPSSSAQHSRLRIQAGRELLLNRVAWADCATVLAPQMSKAACWEDYLPWVLQVGTWSAKIQALVVSSLCPLLCYNWIPCSQASQTSPQCLWGKTRVRPPRSNPQCWGSYMSSVGSLFPLEDHKGDLSLRCWAGLGGGPCGPLVAAPLTFLLFCLGLCDVGGTSAALSCSRIFSVVSCP